MSSKTKLDTKADYYSILNVPKNATVQEIRKQYLAFALKYHPDRNYGNETMAIKKFQQVQTAYDVLTDVTKRRVCDSSRPTKAPGTSRSSSSFNNSFFSRKTSAYAAYREATKNHHHKEDPRKSYENPKHDRRRDKNDGTLKDSEYLLNGKRFSKYDPQSGIGIRTKQRSTMKESRKINVPKFVRKKDLDSHFKFETPLPERQTEPLKTAKNFGAPTSFLQFDHNKTRINRESLKPNLSQLKSEINLDGPATQSYKVNDKNSQTTNVLSNEENHCSSSSDTFTDSFKENKKSHENVPKHKKGSTLSINSNNFEFSFHNNPFDFPFDQQSNRSPKCRSEEKKSEIKSLPKKTSFTFTAEKSMKPSYDKCFRENKIQSVKVDSMYSTDNGYKNVADPNKKYPEGLNSETDATNVLCTKFQSKLNFVSNGTVEDSLDHA
ncbi:meiotically upregulated Mug184 [Schizosaccharomyces octosporus yFS286]|uniref:Meiotically upregulated Mug184 n=1 Tax=Schizosaccharomyces octosporus (strain yFS286) TaxID=483514 RepID=S9RB38_SCHOY|nr:meiotically upregulated Mug184 [Schizosaccharomyces octosporus yFS286]EPX75355.1 meiotically upregulated Mug184 [Schizosaccharomyces octosporus yFS286]